MADYSGSGTGAELDKAADLVSTGTSANLITTGTITSGLINGRDIVADRNYADVTVLTSAHDLDDYITASGFYAWTATSPTNAPTSDGASTTYKSMIAQFDGSQCTQMVWGGSASGVNTIHVRRRNSGVWGAWTEFYNGTGDLTITTGGVILDPTEKIYLDGGTHTYIAETAADQLEIWVGNARGFRQTAVATTLYFNTTLSSGDLTVSAGNLLMTAGNFWMANNTQFVMRDAAATGRQVMKVTTGDELNIGNSVFATVLGGSSHTITTGDLTVSAGRIEVSDANETAQYAAKLYNTHATGYGVIAKGGDGAGSALLVQDYSGTNRMQVSGAGDLTMYTGNVVIGTSGKGIDFSATADASGMTSELLDDYEEGDWTPSVTDNTNNATLSSAVGKYQKVGNRVHFQGYFVVSSMGSVSGGVNVAGLPYQASSISNNYSSIYCGYALNMSITAGESVSGYVQRTSDYVKLTIWNSAGGINALQDSEFTATTVMMIAGSYEV